MMTSRVGSKGFTLIELVVVLLLIGIASSVVIISIAREYEKSVIKYETRKLFAALKHSRESSISQHKEVTFEIDEENSRYSIGTDKGTIIKRVLPEKISIYSEKIVFYPIGDSTGGTITLQDEDGREYEIRVSNITGKPKVQRIQSP